MYKKIAIINNVIYNFNKANIAEIKNLGRGMINDMRVRWNSTYLMINRFLAYKPVIEEITNYPYRLEGLKRSKQAKLEKLRLLDSDWETLEVLSKCLSVFDVATNILSKRKYHTLSLVFYIKKLIGHFLSNKKQTKLSNKEALIRKILFAKFNFYFDKYFDKTQNEKISVLIFH